jgi:ferrous iron transport protein B
MNELTIAVAGNPNCGKTTLFNALTGARQRVGNWPGVTVEKKTGEYEFDGCRVQVVDLPGIYSMDLPHGSAGVDEEIARDYLLSGEASLVVNIVDGANLERNLYLTSQLLEMRVPMVVAVNMMDKAEKLGLKIDLKALGDRLGCPVIPLVAARGQGVDELRRQVEKSSREPHPPATAIGYGETLDTAIAGLMPRLRETAAMRNVHPRWLALKLLEEEDLALRMAGRKHRDAARALAARVEEQSGEEIDILVADARYGFVHGVVQQCVTRQGEVARTVTALIDRVVLNRVLGIPIFLAVMYLMFLFTIHIGGAFIDFFDLATGALFVDGLKSLLATTGSPEWLQVVLADGLGGGVRTVATFIPVVGFLFLFLSVLEDSGYMTRAAFVMDRLMRGIGLPGKSFVPLLVGFGCNVPAVMATRTLENPRDRLLTIFMAPFMSCGARLPVYALFAAAFFPASGQNLVFGLYLTGIAMAMLTGLIFKNTLLRGQSAPFVTELPHYHLPTLKGIGIRAWERTRSFLLKAGRIIVPMVMVLAVLNSTGTDGSFGNEDSDRSVLSRIGRALTPVFAPMGITGDNWPATVGLLSGVMAKEAVVGTLDSIYGRLARTETSTTNREEEVPLSTALGEALATIPANLADAIGGYGDPLGLDIGEVSGLAVATGTIGTMISRFDGQAGAFAYLLFILLYSPCTATLAAIHREAGGRWALSVAAWTTGLAYATATIGYQLATFGRHPESSSAWVACMLLLFALAVRFMRHAGRTERTTPAIVAGKA